MISMIYSVYDDAAKAFLPPFFVRSKGEAVRSFSSAVGQSDHQFSKFKSDYTLFELGSYDDVTGLITPFSVVSRVMSAIEVGDVT